MGRPKKIVSQNVKKSVGRPKKVKTIEVLTTGYLDVLENPIVIKYSNYVDCVMDLFINLGLKKFINEQMNLLDMTYVKFYTDKYLAEMISSEIQLFYQGRIDLNVLKMDIGDLCKRYKMSIDGHQS